MSDRQVRRLERAVDELIKIHDDGAGTENTRRMLDDLHTEIARRRSASR